jgi:hypothetical protein
MGVFRGFVKSPSTQSLRINESKKIIQTGVAAISAGCDMRSPELLFVLDTL